MRKKVWANVLLLVAVLISLLACKAPAEFELMSLEVTPPEVTSGDPVSVTAGVKNIGGSEGVYNATLTVEGVEAETKEVTVAPGDTETITFSLLKDEAGSYQVAIGDLSSAFVVKEKEPISVAKEIELKYDDGDARDCISASPPILTGHLVNFTPSSIPFTIKKVQVYGGIYGSGWEGKDFEVEIWGKDHKVLHGATYPVTKFPVAIEFKVEESAWVDIEIPDIEVTDKFYVHVYTGTGRLQGIHVGADDSVVNEHSDVTVRTAGGTTRILAQWPYLRTLWFGDKSKVNWMIRVVGTVMVAEGE